MFNRTTINFLFIFIISIFHSQFAFSAQTDIFNTNQVEFLPIEKAFIIDAFIKNNQINVQFNSKPGYYFYKDKIKIIALHGLSISTPQFPKPERIHDPFENKELSIYKEAFNVLVPITSINSHDTVITVKFQGCAEAGLCYPPQTINLTLQNLEMPKIATDTNQIKASTSTGLLEQEYSSTNTEDSFFTSLLEKKNYFAIFGTFFLGGLLLAFTPCVLPMLPILSTIIVGKNIKGLQATLLSLSYVLGMSLTYACLGMLMGAFGASFNIQAKLQSAWLIIPFSGFFILLAISMFGVFELQLPEKLRSKLMATDNKVGQKFQGTFIGAALMGVLASLLVSPCVSAPLAGVLVYISSSSDFIIGGIALLSLGFGMGIPLLIIGAGGQAILPKSGIWMQKVKQIMGISMLFVAELMLDRVLPQQISSILWASLWIGSGLYLGALTFNTVAGWATVRQTCGILLLIYGGLSAINGFNEQITKTLPIIPPLEPTISTTNFERTTDIESYGKAFNKAATKGKPIIIEVYADWCQSCKEMEKNVLAKPEIKERLSNFSLIKLDISKHSPELAGLLNKHQVFGPPSFLFFDNLGNEIVSLRIRGSVTSDVFKTVLDKATQ